MLQRLFEPDCAAKSLAMAGAWASVQHVCWAGFQVFTTPCQPHFPLAAWREWTAYSPFAISSVVFPSQRDSKVLCVCPSCRDEIRVHHAGSSRCPEDRKLAVTALAED
jgi:hypothetical protein